MRRSSYGMILAAAATVAATVYASSIAVNSASAPGADFSRYKSYAWSDTLEVRNQLVKKRLVDAVDRQLQAKSLVRKDEGADLRVAMHARLAKDSPADADPTGWDYGWGTWAPGIGDLSVGKSAKKASDLPVGTVIVDLVDTSKKEVVWRGVATSPIDSEASAEKEQNLFDEAMQKLFAGFPPKKK